MKNKRYFKIGVFLGFVLFGCCVGLYWMCNRIEQLPWGVQVWLYSHFESLIPEHTLSPKNNIKHFAKALAERDVSALAQHIVFPFEREYPLPPIETIEEFIAAIPELFKEEDIKGMQDVDEWDKVGWRGYMYKNGVVWLSEDFLLTAAGGLFGTEKEHVKWSDCVKNEIASLHPSLRVGVVRPLLSFITEDGVWRGRIDKMESRTEDDEFVYRLAAYKACTPITAKADVLVMCKNKIEGSACNEYFVTKDSIEDSEYMLSINRAGHIDDAEMDFRYPGMNADGERAGRAKPWVWK